MSASAGRTLPASANLEHLKNDAKDRLAQLRRIDPKAKLTAAQLAIARGYGFASWRALRAALESAEKTLPTPDEVARKRAEQALPRTAIPFDPKRFDRFTGFYRLGSTMMTISRKGRHFYMEVMGQIPVEVYPESESKFFASVVPAQISFVAGSGAQASILLLHQNGHEQDAERIGTDEAAALKEALAARLRDKAPAPGSEEALRHHIAGLWAGRPAYEALTPALAVTVRQQMPAIREWARLWGPLKAITFKAPTQGGMDVYEVLFENAQTQWTISPPRPDGRIGLLGMKPVP
jgi:hypothetical protein